MLTPGWSVAIEASATETLASVTAGLRLRAWHASETAASMYVHFFVASVCV